VAPVLNNFTRSNFCYQTRVCATVSTLALLLRYPLKSLKLVFALPFYTWFVVSLAP